jgi:hypothetical protein
VELNELPVAVARVSQTSAHASRRSLTAVVLELIRPHAASFRLAATAAPNGGQTGAFESAGIRRQCKEAVELAMAWPAVRAAGLRPEQLVAVPLLVTNDAATVGLMGRNTGDAGLRRGAEPAARAACSGDPGSPARLPAAQG